jgi:DmsE family decaheme c-type cytochrome
MFLGSMIAANHHRPGNQGWHGELRPTTFAGDLLALENVLPHIMTNSRYLRGTPTQSSLSVFRVFLLIFLFFVVFASGQTTPAAASKSVQSNRESAADKPSSEASKYVGAETCKTCHEEIYNAWEKTPHWKTTLNPKGGPSKQGCEGCHGPGADHVAGGGDKTKIFVFGGKSRQETSARCLTCHGEAHEQSHFAQSAHSSSDVGCLDCHSPHHAKGGEFLLVQEQPQLCYGCHTSAKADFAKPYHHRVNEGLVQCVDCHNPHGTATVRQLRSLPSGDAVCYTCHVDKQGPFVYEHVPVKTEGCSSCHSPHGSTNPKLLNVMPVSMLCLQCHTFSTTLTAGGPSGPGHNQSAKYQACTMCHTQIHGSNFSNVFFK